ncbi:MAG: Ubiquinone biosynthesis O-methyltransferase [Bacteroidia bacterium]|nr:Ubiquinone biosynthesis O-methyltransferase [Bacteroidia bacterium]
MEKKDIEGFYNNFSEEYTKLGLNRRHRLILKKLIAAGLQKNHRVLEIGCGVGQVTGLMSDYLSNGMVVACDISPEGIELAKKIHRKRGNIQFTVSDMTDFKHDVTFDFVVLPDVIEHIPVENHKDLFRVIKQNISMDGTVAINTPTPFYQEWLHKKHPEGLQIIDQPIYTNDLLNSVYPNGFYLERLENYCIRHKEADYQWILLKPYKAVEDFHKMSVIENSIESLKTRLL